MNRIIVNIVITKTDGSPFTESDGEAIGRALGHGVGTIAAVFEAEGLPVSIDVGKMEKGEPEQA